MLPPPIPKTPASDPIVAEVDITLAFVLISFKISFKIFSLSSIAKFSSTLTFTLIVPVSIAGISSCPTRGMTTRMLIATKKSKTSM